MPGACHTSLPTTHITLRAGSEKHIISKTNVKSYEAQVSKGEACSAYPREGKREERDNPCWHHPRRRKPLANISS